MEEKKMAFSVIFLDFSNALSRHLKSPKSKVHFTKTWKYLSDIFLSSKKAKVRARILQQISAVKC